MDENKLYISGIGLSQNVIAAVVARAAEKVEGVVRVGGNDVASSLISVFTRRSTSPEAAVEAEVVDGKLHVCAHLAVFYGYPFTQIAAAAREAIAVAISSQIGVEVCSVDICIDSLVFPKE